MEALKNSQALNIETVAVMPRWDGFTAAQIESDILERIAHGAHEIILDCAELSFLTGAGLRSLLGLAKTLHDKEIGLAVTGLRPQARAIFMACGYDAWIPQQSLSE